MIWRVRALRTSHLSSTTLLSNPLRHCRTECDPANYDKVHRKKKCPVAGCKEKLTRCGCHGLAWHHLPPGSGWGLHAGVVCAGSCCVLRMPQ